MAFQKDEEKDHAFLARLCQVALQVVTETPGIELRDAYIAGRRLAPDLGLKDIERGVWCLIGRRRIAIVDGKKLFAGSGG